MDCTPASLLQNASCFSCLDKKQLLAIQTYLLAVRAGGSIVPSELLQSAVAFTSLSKKQLMALSVYSLCQQVSGVTPPPPQTAPLLVAAGSGIINWTWTPASPALWAAQNSEDGSTAWNTETNTLNGALRTYAVANSGLFYRIIGTDGSMNPVTGFSNVVSTA